MNRPESADPYTGELDPVIHVPARLRILVTLSTLATGDSLSFGRLRDLLELTAGNLLAHLRRLEQAGYVTTTTTGRSRTQTTTVALTATGRAALESYRATLQGLLGAVPEPARSPSRTRRVAGAPETSGA